MAVQGEMRFVDRSSFYGYITDSWYFWMDKSKWEIHFHNLWGIKWHIQTGENAILSGQQKQQNVVVVAAVMDNALWLF